MLDRHRIQTGGIVALACAALIATSAPETAIVQDANGIDNNTAATDFEVHVNEEGICDATSMEVNVQVIAVPTAEDEMAGAEPVIARLIPADASLTTIEIPMAFDSGNPQGMMGEGRINTLTACPEDEACTLRFSVALEPSRSYDVDISARILNDSSGCAITNPSFDEDARVDVNLL